MTTPRSLATAFALTTLLSTGVSACGSSNSSAPSAQSSSPSSSSNPTAPASESSTSSSTPSPSSGPSTAVPTNAPVKKGLTSDYPKADVPLISGKVVKSVAVAETASGRRVKGWTVQISTGGTVAGALAAVRAAMLNKGFHQQGGEKQLGGHAVEVTYVGPHYQNRVLVGPAKPGVGVIYNVTPH